MPGKSRKIYVYDSFSADTPLLLGCLYLDEIRGTESYSFEHDDGWLQKTGAMVIIDPNLLPYGGRQYPSGQSMFGAFSDASPDRWGRMLIMKRERIAADREGRKPGKLTGTDFLLGVDDRTRMGGLRFKLDPDGEFLADDRDSSVPPWTSLRTLEEASRHFENDDTPLNEKWLNQLLRPGSSLGGARPKATVADVDGTLWIAKFPSKNDENNTGAWEKVVSDLARMCCLNAPESRIETFSPLGATFLVKRFDRNGDKRIHFASAMTLLGKTDGASAADGTGYLDIAGFIKAYSICPKKDLKELWRRIVFNMCVSNTDDHLRNHAFILQKRGWALSPVYDVNPVPYGDELSLNVNENSNEVSIALAIDSARYYGLDKVEAETEALNIARMVSGNWEKLASKYRLTRARIEDMRPAFSESWNWSNT